MSEERYQIKAINTLSDKAISSLNDAWAKGLLVRIEKHAVENKCQLVDLGPFHFGQQPTITRDGVDNG